MTTEKRDAELFRSMLEVAEANGFESLTDAIAQAVRAKAENAALVADNAALVAAINDWEDGNADAEMRARVLAKQPHPGAELLAQHQRLTEALDWAMAYLQRRGDLAAVATLAGKLAHPSATTPPTPRKS